MNKIIVKPYLFKLFIYNIYIMFVHFKKYNVCFLLLLFVFCAVYPVLTQQPLLVEKTEYDLCPSCGEAALAYEEGCKKCYSCGYSEC